jgi:single-strand DNA-binding protein
VTEQRTNDPVYGLVGVLGKDPKQKAAGNSGKTVTEFTLAVTTGYGDDAKPTWYDVSVWNEGLQESVKSELYKGAKVAVEGFYSVREYNGVHYPQLRATRVGLIDWLQKTAGTGSASAPTAPGPAPLPAPAPAPAAPAAQAAAEDDGDLPF